jgi:hypothetical protein
VLFIEPRIVPGIKRCSLLTAAAVICSSLIGCTAAYNVRTVNSPDWKCAATCYIRGSFGRSYLADTKKKIVISIFAVSPDAKERSEKEAKEASAAGVGRGDHNPGAIITATNTLLFRKEYWVKGSDLNWSSLWGEHNNLAIVFYDYGAGVGIPYSSENDAPNRLLRTIHYQFDSGVGIYREEPFKQ